MKRQKGNLTDWEGLELQDTAVPLWLRLGLLDPRCLEEAGPGTSEEEVLPLGRGVRSLAPSSPRTESSEKGCHPVVLGGSVTSLVLGVERTQKLESTAGLENGTSLFLLLLPLVALPLEHSTVRTHWGAGWKRRNCGLLSPSPGSTELRDTA